MEAHLDLGDKSTALRCYHRYAGVLEHDLGLTPGKEIEDLYRTGMVLSAGRVTVVGAAKDPDSQRALFLFLQASPR